MIRQYISNTLVFALSVAFLWHLSCIAITGSHYIQEPNDLILGAEMVTMVSFIIFASWAVVSQLRGQRKVE